MAEKFLTVDTTTGQKKLQEATTTSSGSADAGKIVALNTVGKIDETLLPTGIGAETAVLPATEDLSAGALVNIYDNAGTLSVRNADAASGFKADGFVLAAVLTGNNATIYLDGINNQLSALTPGAIYYLSTGGTITTTVPATAGELYQVVGKATSATELIFERNEPILLG